MEKKTDLERSFSVMKRFKDVENKNMRKTVTAKQTYSLKLRELERKLM